MLATGVPLGVKAQDVDEFRRRVLELERRRDLASEQFHTALMRAGVARTDTIFVGTMTVVTQAPALETVRRGAEIAWESVRSWLGRDTLRLVDDVLYVPTAEARASEIPTDIYVGALLRRGATADDAAVLLVQLIGRSYAAQVDTVIHQSAGTRVFTPHEAGPATWPWFDLEANLGLSYRELATSPFSRAKQCFAGDLEGCHTALGLRANLSPARDWYDASDRRLLVSTHRNTSARQRTRHMACLDDRDDAACIEFLELRPSTLRAPLSQFVLATVVEFAVDLGGDGAYGRLIDAHGQPFSEQLAAAAGLPSDSLLAAWRSAVDAARPSPTTMTLPVGAAALLWIGMFGLAAARSTRWRSD
jgi:hypothetical protein